MSGTGVVRLVRGGERQSSVEESSEEREPVAREQGVEESSEEAEELPGTPSSHVCKVHRDD